MISNFPRVGIPGQPLAPEVVQAMGEISAQHTAWRRLKVGMAFALIKRGAQPYVKPPRAEIDKRRAANKRARKARKAGRK